MGDVPFAPHSPGWTKCENPRTAYAVLDGRMVESMDAEVLTEAIMKSAGEFLGGEAIFEGGTWAGDFFCGKVLIVYCSLEAEEVKDG